MYCPSCGKQIENLEARFCPVCGASLNIQGNGNDFQTTNNYQWEANNYSYETNNYQPELPMKWYKFVIYFQLFFSGFFAIVTALRTMTGNIYGVGSDVSALYEAFPALRSTNIFFGILWIVYAVFAVFFVRKHLVDYKSNAIILLLICYVISPIIDTVHLVIQMGIVHLSFSDIGGASQIMGQWIGIIILVILSYIYFNKRKHMFTN